MFHTVEGIAMAGELIQLAKDFDDSLGNLPSWAIGKGGEIVFTELFKSRVQRLFRKFSKAKSDGSIPPDFEQTEHGQTLLQEALNALWTARDQQRAEAIQRVFLGLAMNPVEDSLAQVEQLHILRLTAEMTTWEVVLCNALERFRIEKFDKETSEKLAAATGEIRRQSIVQMESSCQSVAAWLKHNFTGGDQALINLLVEATQSLHQKHVLKYDWSNNAKAGAACVYDPHGAFSDFGWKLAQHLYSAEVPAGQQAYK